MKLPKILSALFVALLVPAAVRAADPVAVKWLDGPSPVNAGVSWGVPLPRGAYQKVATFALTQGDAAPLPLQNWPLAYWPDGSIKWMGFATIAGPQVAGPLTLAPAKVEQARGVTVKETAESIDIDTSSPTAPGMLCHISRTGANLFDTLKIGERTIAQNLRSELILQKGPENDAALPAPRQRFTSVLTKVTVEQSGPVRAVVKFEGMHSTDFTGMPAGADRTNRRWLPFYVRLYFYQGVTPIKAVYSFVFDGNEKEDFIRGLGLTATIPFAEEIQNRHVRFGGEAGTDAVWAEPVLPLSTYQTQFTSPGTPNAYAAQVGGQRIANRAQLNAQSARLLDTLAKWSDYRLIQPNAQGFTIEKRTGPDGSWLPAASGRRANGYLFAGDVSGGLGVGIQHFWQSAPASLEVRRATSAAAELRAWLWSPDAPAMDMRHYDTVAHGLNESYEDVEMPLATAQGIAHTSALTLFPAAGIPAREEMARQVKTAAEPPLLVCTPQYLHDQKAFGVWSLQDRSTPFKKYLEDQLDAEMAFYMKAVDQFNWYGFWYFGDVMHSYDATRQMWKYDIGGFAWDNSEQGTDMVAWYMFLRTGRADLFRHAEAMTRHTGEVICYHQGPLAGLGSRHNVVPWGDGAKEARISMAPYRRFYYYLTTDERTGDVMREMLQADSAITRIDPMRKVIPPTAADAQFPARVRGGPDWFAFLGNWMTEWERTGDTKYRDKIITSFDSVAAMPFGFSTSQSLLWGFFPETGKVVPRDRNRGGYNLVNNMGGPEVMMELNDLIDHPGWKKAWLDYCSTGSGRLAGYYYVATGDVAAAQRAVSGIRGGVGANFMNPVERPGPLRPLEIPQPLNGLVTNDANQSSLQIIEVLDLCKDQLPVEAPAAGGGRGRGRGAQPAAPATTRAN